MTDEEREHMIREGQHVDVIQDISALEMRVNFVSLVDDVVGEPNPPTLEYVLKLIARLSPQDRRRLDLYLAAPARTPTPASSLYGVLAPLGQAPSAEDIDEVRREMWGNFPRDDV